MRQGERRIPLRAVRGCPGPHGGDSFEAERPARDRPFLSRWSQPFAYAITGSMS